MRVVVARGTPSGSSFVSESLPNQNELSWESARLEDANGVPVVKTRKKVERVQTVTILLLFEV
jgi:hypothetical protein